MSSPVKSPKIKVFVAEDHAWTRSGIFANLDSYDDIEVVPNEAKNREYAEQMPSTTEETLKLILKSKPDVVLLDIKWGPDEFAGIKLARKIREAREFLPIVKVLVHTQFHDQERVRRAVLEGQVDGYLLKEHPGSLVTAIRTVCKELPYYDPEVVKYLLAIIRSPMHTAPSSDNFRLTETEQHVLKRLARGESNERIAQILHLSPNAIKTINQKVYEKLGVYPNLPGQQAEDRRKVINTRVMAILKGLELGLLNLSDLVPTRLSLEDD